jgi:3-deoxy-D-manno-octulosonate 8-phosphate phosphatase (KDO 8-P phosphatase)
LAIATQLCKTLNISITDTAYIGDDFGDVELLKSVGFSCAPANAPSYIKNLVNYVTVLKGGEGAFREFVEELLRKTGTFDEAMNMVLNHKK